MIDCLRKISILKFLKNKGLSLLRQPYLPKLRANIDSECSVITNNCFGGRIPQDLGYPYNSPTAGLFICYPDYIFFLKNLKQAINQKITFRGGESKYPEIDDYLKTLSWKVPVGYITIEGIDIEIVFLHYHSEQEALDKWERRCKLINFNKLIIFGSDNDRCTKQDISEFLSLPYENKFFFSAHDYGFPNTNEYAYIKEMSRDGKVNTYNRAHILYRYLTRLKYS